MTNNNFTVYTSVSFLKDMKRFIKKKKFIKLQEDLDDFKREHLETGDFIGDVITHIDSDPLNPVYKVRMANTTINVGLSNGFRIVYHVEYDNEIVVLHTIYYKKEEHLTNDEIIKIVESYNE